MTANQIMIPAAIILFFAFIGYLIIHEKRTARAKADGQRDHRPNASTDRQDDGAVARSIAEGFGAGGGPS